MVFLTRLLCKRDPNKSRFYKLQEIFRTTGHLIGRARSEKKLAILKRDLDWGKQTRMIRAGWVERENNKFVDQRLTAACYEHRVTLTTFLDSLARMSIQLDKMVLSNLAIYEPRTFESLAVLAKQYAIENGHVFDHETTFIPPPPTDSVVLDERVHEIPELIKKFK